MNLTACVVRVWGMRLSEYCDLDGVSTDLYYTLAEQCGLVQYVHGSYCYVTSLTAGSVAGSRVLSKPSKYG
jgi:hypothetical protein